MISLFKSKKDNFKMPEGLTRAEKKEVKKIIEEARRENSVPHTAQESIPFERMFKDGICRVNDDYYTKGLPEDAGTEQ